MSFLAKLESAIAPDAPAPEPKVQPRGEEVVEALDTDEGTELDESTEGEESESDEAEPESADDDTDPESADNDTDLDTGSALDDKIEYQVAPGEKVSGAELRKGYLRQADYTRKTQALAEERKAATDKLTALAEENEEFKDWALGLRDPEDMRLELETHFPDAFAKLRDKILEEAIEEHGMSDRERELYRKNRENANKDRIRSKAAAYEAKKTEKAQVAQKTADLAKSFNTWTDEVMAETGLDPKKAEHVDLLRAKVSTYRNTKWTKDTFLESAKLVAKALGVKPKPKVEVKPKAPAAKLPPVRSQGGKKPAGKKIETETKKPALKGTSSYFSDLRKQAGLV